MKAEELFKQLGFKKYSDDNITLSYSYDSRREKTKYMVVFYFDDRSYQVYSVSYSIRLFSREKMYYPIYEPYRISKDMHKAIITQLDELGWW